MRRVHRAVALIALLSIQSIHPGFATDPPVAPKVQVGDVPPDALGTDLHNRRVSVSDYRGKVVVVSFWASWCAPCQKEMGVLDAMQRSAGDGDLQIIAVNDDESDEMWVRFQRVLKDVKIKITHDVTKHVTANYGVSSIPHMFIVDRTGHVAQIHKGYSEKQLDRLIDNINAVLAQQ